jgi:hypothetical protein
MTKRSKKAQKSHAKLHGFVVVAFAEDLEQAGDYKALLEANDISAVVSEQDEQSIASKEIAVMVPEDCLDEAHVVIESQHAYDDFYDLALDDETESDFDSDLLEDDF